MFFAETPDGYVTERNGSRLDCNSGKLLLPLVLLAVSIVVVTYLQSLQVLARPRSMEVVEHQMDRLFLFHACGDVRELKLQHPEIVFFDVALNFHLGRIIRLAINFCMSLADGFNASSSLKGLVTSPVFVGRPDHELKTFTCHPFSRSIAIVSRHSHLTLSIHANLGVVYIKGCVVESQGQFFFSIR